MKCFFNTAVLAFILLGVVKTAAADDTMYLHSKEITLPQYQEGQLEKDQPFQSSLFDASGHLWLIGKTSAWKWTIGEKSLQRVQLTTAREPLISMEKSNGYLFVATDRSLFRIKFEPQEIIQFRHPAKGIGKTGRLVAGSQTVWWIHNDGLAWFDQDSKLKHYPAIKGQAGVSRPAWFDHSNRLQWFIEGQSLVKVDYRHSPPKQERVHQARHNFSDIHGDDNFVMVHTNHTIIRFDRNHVIKQIIPVDAQRKIIASDISSNIHSYFFNDRLLEIYDLEKKIKYQSKLPVDVTSKVNDLLTFQNYTAIIADGIPRLFSHEKNLNITQSKTNERPAKG